MHDLTWFLCQPYESGAMITSALMRRTLQDTEGKQLVVTQLATGGEEIPT